MSSNLQVSQFFHLLHFRTDRLRVGQGRLSREPFGPVGVVPGRLLSRRRRLQHVDAPVGWLPRPLHHDDFHILRHSFRYIRLLRPLPAILPCLALLSLRYLRGNTNLFPMNVHYGIASCSGASTKHYPAPLMGLPPSNTEEAEDIKKKKATIVDFGSLLSVGAPLTRHACCI